MKLRSLLLAGVLSVSAATAFACHFCLGHSNHKAAKTTMADAGEGDYDIKHLLFNLNVTDTSIYIKGNVTTTAQVTASSMSQYVFELSTTMIIDSAKFNGVPATVSTSGVIRRITPITPLPAGSIFSAQIFYHGMPPSGGGFFNGVTHAVSSHGTHMVYTVSDPWVALNWWPVKQSVNDQADSVDMFVTVPAGVTGASNGLLVSVDNTSLPGYSTFHWQTKYPIDYYLISIAVARYSEYKSYMHFTGSTDSMLVQNFLMDTAWFNPLYKRNFDSVAYTIDYFSQLYGRYPFWQEKYGMAFTNLGGGMEHQTMTTIGVTGTSTIAHELAHQWFGDHVTYKTWGDMWLSEGFATFSEAVYLEKFWSSAAARSQRFGYLGQAYGAPCGMTYVNDTTTSDSLFTTNQYPKAAMIINTLRYMAPDDSVFFRMLRHYQTTYGGKNASTADFKAIAEAEYGTSLDTFFNQWIYGRGFPIYKVSWNQAGSTVFVKLMQSQSCPSYTRHFSTPVEVQLHSASADTIIKVYNSIDTQVFTFDWAPTVSAIYINNNAQTLLKVTYPISKDATLGMGAITPGKIRIHPNPSKNSWQVDALPEDTALALVDMTGRIIWQGNSNSGSTTIPGERLPAGNYLLRIAGTIEESVKLVHW